MSDPGGPVAGGRFTRGELAVVGTAAALVFSRVFGLSVVLPNFRGHYESAFAVDPFWIGVALGAHGLTMALMQFPAGWISDRVGRRTVLLAASLVFVAGSVWAALAASPTSLIMARFLQGLGAVSSVAMAAVGEQVPAARRTTAMAMVGIPAGLGFFVGVIVGPLLAPVVGVPGLFWLTAGVGALAAVPVLLAPFTAVLQRPAAEAAARGLGMGVVALAAAGFLNNYSLQTVVFFLPDASWQRLLPPLLLTLLVVVVASRLVDRLRATWWPPTAAVLAAAAAAAVLVLGGDSSWGLYFAGAALFFSCHGILSTVLPSQVSRLAGASGGRAHGVQNVCAYTGTFLGGAAAGALALRPEWALAAVGVVAVAAALLLAVGLRGAAPRPGPAAA